MGTVYTVHPRIFEHNYMADVGSVQISEFVQVSANSELNSKHHSCCYGVSFKTRFLPQHWSGSKHNILRAIKEWDLIFTIDNRPTEKGLETRNFFGNFPFRCALRSRDLEMALASCSEHLQEL